MLSPYDREDERSGMSDEPESDGQADRELDEAELEEIDGGSGTDVGLLPPEINSGRLYSGPGQTP
jgi:hypothetical protein